MENGNDAVFQIFSHLINNNYVPGTETDARSTEVNKARLYT